MSSYGRTFMLVAAMTALFGGIGFMMGGPGGMMIALAIAVAAVRGYGIAGGGSSFLLLGRNPLEE